MIHYQLDDWNGRIVQGERFAQAVQVVGFDRQHFTLPGVTFRDCVFRRDVTMYDCSQCMFERCWFVGAALWWNNLTRWSENNTVRDVTFAGGTYTMAFQIAGENGKPSHKGFRADTVRILNCQRGIICDGAVYDSRFTHIVGNFTAGSKYAMSLGGNMLNTVIEGVGFEGGDRDTVLFDIREFDQPKFRPTIRDYLYRGREDQTGV